MTYKSDFLNVLNERGFIHQCSDFEALDKKLMEGVQSAYIGFDATAKSLHVGNLTGIMMLKWFQETGHKPITLMGGGTSKIGDPSFKDQSRNLMTDDTITENIENIRTTCFTQFLKYGDGATDALMVNNDDWLSELKYLDFLRDYGRYFTVNRMISFDSVKTRLERESPLTLLEFNYMVMQGYDFVELRQRYGTILQMGGSDQWGNIINGVDLAHKSDQVQLYALTAPLLLNSAGEKMGKTVNGAVWLNPNMLSAYDYWQYFRNVEDALVGTMLRRFTMLALDEIKKLEALQGQEINEAKKILADEATKLCRGEEEAKKAREDAEKMYASSSMSASAQVSASADIVVLISRPVIENGISAIDLFLEAKLAKSKGEVRRLIQGGGAKCNDEPITDVDAIIGKDHIIDDNFIKLSSGKKNHKIIKLS